MNPEPWTLRSLPTGLAQSDFQDAAVALSSQQITGRVIPVPAATNRGRGLSGTHYTNNAKRIVDALRFPPLTGLSQVSADPGLGLVLPGILWLDSSPADGTRAVACIGPNGYYGSLYAGDLSRELHNFVRAEAQRNRLIAVPLELSRTIREPSVARNVHVWLPMKTEEIERLRRWLKTPAAVEGGRYVPKVEIKAWLKRLGDYREELESLLAGAEQAQVRVKLSVEATQTGKYVGQNFVTASVLDRTIGMIPAQYRSENPEFFAAIEAGTTTATGRVFKYPERIGVQVVLD
jgi:hypothetical protein